MGFCKPMSEEVPLINTKTISKEELDAQRENAAKVQAVLQSRYTDKPLACVITYGCQQNVADSEHIKGMLADMGYAFTDDRHKAQFVLFNTCAVREHAEQRVFGNVGALKGLKEKKRGLMIGIEIDGSGPELRKKLLFDKHIFTGGAGASTVRLLPALCLTKEMADRFLTAFDKVKGEK